MGISVIKMFWYPSPFSLCNISCSYMAAAPTPCSHIYAASSWLPEQSQDKRQPMLGLLSAVHVLISQLTGHTGQVTLQLSPLSFLTVRALI